jgi:hypothetical protein
MSVASFPLSDVFQKVDLFPSSGKKKGGRDCAVRYQELNPTVVALLRTASAAYSPSSKWEQYEHLPIFIVNCKKCIFYSIIRSVIHHCRNPPELITSDIRIIFDHNIWCMTCKYDCMILSDVFIYLMT